MERREKLRRAAVLFENVPIAITNDEGVFRGVKDRLPPKGAALPI
jgi:hypothetical protein